MTTWLVVDGGLSAEGIGGGCSRARAGSGLAGGWMKGIYAFEFNWGGISWPGSGGRVGDSASGSRVCGGRRGSRI
ncbi:hypothetical protein [Actinoplanes sp. N902-109]|uniref:hypothetical protein n=1 Tax=Actinoplanes sp. (strain N902-109) TaxID=649831 RepID=UPI0012F8E77F|nr:hypothetical protein [Actinoplanes sp. N902-109]